VLRISYRFVFCEKCGRGTGLMPARNRESLNGIFGQEIRGALWKRESSLKKLAKLFKKGEKKLALKLYAMKRRLCRWP